MLFLLLALAGQDASHVTPLNVQQWVTEDDYPASALRNDEAGEVGFDLTVAGDGSVEHCEISRSSGFVDLDATTCTLLTRRARFSTPRPGLHYRGRLTWKIPEPEPEPIAWGHSAGVLSLSADNQILSCENKFAGSATEALGKPCELVGASLPPPFLQVIGNPGKPRTVVMEMTTFYGQEPMPARYYARPGQVPIVRLLARFDIAESGKVENCRDVSTGMEGWLKNLPSPCTWHLGPYVSPVDKAGNPHAMSGAIEVAISQGP